MTAAARLADDAALARADARLAGAPRCDRCGIQLPHVCIREQLASVAASRPGSPFAPPVLIDLERGPTDSRGEGVRGASRRLGVPAEALRIAVLVAGLKPAASGRWKLAPAQYDQALAAARRAGLPSRSPR